MIYFHQRDIIHRDLKSSNGALYLHIQLLLFAASVRNCLVGYKGTWDTQGSKGAFNLVLVKCDGIHYAATCLKILSGGTQHFICTYCTQTCNSSLRQQVQDISELSSLLCYLKDYNLSVMVHYRLQCLYRKLNTSWPPSVICALLLKIVYYCNLQYVLSLAGWPVRLVCTDFKLAFITGFPYQLLVVTGDVVRGCWFFALQLVSAQTGGLLPVYSVQ